LWLVSGARSFNTGEHGVYGNSAIAMSVLDSNPHIHITKCIGQLPGVLPAIGRVGPGGQFNGVTGTEGVAETGTIQWHSRQTGCGFRSW